MAVRVGNLNKDRRGPAHGHNCVHGAASRYRLDSARSLWVTLSGSGKTWLSNVMPRAAALQESLFELPPRGFVAQVAKPMWVCVGLSPVISIE